MCYSRLASRAFQSILLLTEGIRHFRTKCVASIIADQDRNEQHLKQPMAVATAPVRKTSRLMAFTGRASA